MKLKPNIIFIVLITALCCGVFENFGKETIGFAQSTIVGEVKKIDSAKSEITLNTGKGEEYLVKFTSKTTFKQIPPGVKNLDTAKTISSSEISVGDRLLAAGNVVAESKTVEAFQIIVISNRDLSKAAEEVSEQWKTNGIVGEIVSVDLTNKSSVAKIRENGNNNQVTLHFTETVNIKKYSNDSVNYQDAVPIKLEDVKKDDLFRALVEKKEDGSYIIKNALIGTFRLLLGTITEINENSREIKINELVSGQAMTVVFNKNTYSRVLTKALAGEINDTLNNKKVSQGNMGQQVKEMPEIDFSKLKVGDMVMLNTISEEKAPKIAALTLLAGVEPILKPIEKNIKASKNKTNFKLGLPEGINSLVLGF